MTTDADYNEFRETFERDHELSQRVETVQNWHIRQLWIMNFILIPAFLFGMIFLPGGLSSGLLITVASLYWLGGAVLWIPVYQRLGREAARTIPFTWLVVGGQGVITLVMGGIILAALLVF